MVTNESDSRMTGKRRRTATQEVSLGFTVHHKLSVLLGQIHNKVTFYSRFAGTLLDLACGYVLKIIGMQSDLQFIHY